MKPYTRTGENNQEEDLRANWRMNGNRHCKYRDRINKKSYRQVLKRRLKKEQF